MMLNRRSFFGAAASAAALGPEALKTAPSKMQTLSLAMDMSGVTAPLEMAVARAQELHALSSSIRPFDFGSRNEYVYRSGFPEIDCLRSVSGVHRKRMEKRLG